MGKMIEGVVLDNALFKKYHDFLSGANAPDSSIRRLFHYMKGGRVVSTIRQYEETKTELQSGLRISLVKAKLDKISVMDAAQRTPFKIILSETNSTFPYVNISNEDEKIENDLVGSYDKYEDRTKAILHLRALCLNASNITIYDKFISPQDPKKEMVNLNVLNKILPRKKLNIKCYDLSDGGRKTLSSICSEWNVEEALGSSSRHDRYIVIDDKIEVILTSGLYHVENTDMDFTYVVRYIKKDKVRFR